MSRRLTLALDQGGLTLPGDGPVVIMRPAPDFDLSALPDDRVRIEQPFKPYFDQFEARGLTCATGGTQDCAAAIVCLPRSRTLARAMVLQACQRSGGGPVIVDGARTDGVDGLLREIRSRAPILGQMSKAHGRIFWFDALPGLFADWQPPETLNDSGFVTTPGVFSADGIDPGSKLLADTLPNLSGRHVADLGAGWGYLGHRLLADKGIETLDLVEAGSDALDCARRNVTDPRARFHWADATAWKPDHRIDAVVTNPPFHTGRAADPALGQAFVAAAARILAPSGHLWLVANRHLPYEATLAERFTMVSEVAGDNRFKVLQGSRPRR
ncbi:class I SAM-dependent methyltransferase [Pukyongiella litopenaei]|uniref:Class I SAM-dependent methyltransferase n=1 Tax=Pukyongiella litopenaei TaxID=2605946 RepID=A0A2S0MQ27_9RHOB|nr:class I SAM-dependent methyltransferase [Pukyongiella litopenaei]AVO38000.1 class I SAM-dependent methyltransferase [Pukyongiella litopenaei]